MNPRPEMMAAIDYARQLQEPPSFSVRAIMTGINLFLGWLARASVVIRRVTSPAQRALRLTAPWRASIANSAAGWVLHSAHPHRGAGGEPLMQARGIEIRRPGEMTTP